MNTFLAAGNILNNPALLGYVVVETDSEGPKVRLGFLEPGNQGMRELVVEGPEALSILRWLRSTARHLDSGSPSQLRNRPTARLEVRTTTRPQCLSSQLAFNSGIQN